MVEHHHPIDHAHQDAHDVLDPDDGDAEFVTDVAQHVGGLIHLGLVEAPQALIGEQQFRPGRERLRKFQLFQPGGAEPVDTGVAVGRKPDHGERAFGRLLRLRPAVPALAEISGERHVLEDRQSMKWPGDLEGAADATVDDPVRRKACELGAIEPHRARGRRERARQHVEDRALARAVGADQAENFAPLHRERHVVDGLEAVKAFDQAFNYEHGGPLPQSRTTYL